MPKVVNRKDGTLTIKKAKPSKAEIRNDMQYLLEQMTELDRRIEVGRKAAMDLKELEKDFDNLCKLAIEEVQDERD